MKEREFSFTYRAEKGFLYERIIFSLGEPLIMVGRANNGLFTPACKKFYARFWMIEAFAGVAVGAQRRERSASFCRHTRQAPGITSPG